ncbi:HlyD family efflux transporter periplasmic adaptor subunit [Sandaracinobacter neustonicus]|uniref:HlyD family efflux transporter periplasmic adaptor subunit n=1 Tax=Sandaracinobacter neustonicus TaxID=1715348 RepID=A0A501XNK8_9SPHN|nr:HlyD family efflux transporter periplasmic adaptor subunit [Sandaracinobacter neustonicus]TPE61737.1 HlyD family efflux transporter periplasmic adaptor subunit [Sandaracinobacter neustonicus]
MTRKTGLLILLLLAVLAVGAAVWWRYGRDPGLPQGFAQGNGRMEMTRTDIAVKYPGRLLEIRVREGDSVRAGDIIAVQDETDVRAQLQGANAARERASAAVGRVQGEALARSAQEKAAAIDLRETVKLYDQKMVSPVEVEQRRVALEGARGGVAAATGGLAEARTTIAQANAQIAQLNAALNDLIIRAPTPGRIEYRIVEPGTVLPAGGRIVSLINPEDVFLNIFLPGPVASKLKIGDEARILPQGFAEPVPARISFVSPEAQFTPRFVETQSERETLSFRVRLTVQPEVARRFAGQLKAGMTADGYVRTDPSLGWPKLPAGR